MVGEYKVRSGFKCNPWAAEKLSGLQLCAFICPCLADPSAATISASRCWLLIQMYSPCLSLPGVGASSDTAVHVYSLVFMSLNKSLYAPGSHGLLAAPDSHTSRDATGRWESGSGMWEEMEPESLHVFTHGCREGSVCPQVRLSVCHFVQDWSICRAFWYIALTFGADIHGAQRWFLLAYFADPLTFLKRHHEVDICGYEWNFSTATDGFILNLVQTLVSPLGWTALTIGYCSVSSRSLMESDLFNTDWFRFAILNVIQVWCLQNIRIYWNFTAFSRLNWASWKM